MTNILIKAQDNIDNTVKATTHTQDDPPFKILYVHNYKETSLIFQMTNQGEMSNIFQYIHCR